MFLYRWNTFEVEFLHSSSSSQSLSFSEGNDKINRIRKYYGFEAYDNSSLVLVNLSITYAIVKVLLPLRIGLCVYCTPYLASMITRSLNGTQRLKTKFLRE